MQKILLPALLLCSLASRAQDKSHQLHFNRLTAVEGTPFVIATMSTTGKMGMPESCSLSFIDTRNGTQQPVEISKGGHLDEIQQVKIDSLGINIIIVSARAVDADQKNGIDRNDSKQLLAISVDGKNKLMLTDSNLFVSAWIIHRHTGTITITGFYDSDQNGRRDAKDKGAILVYNLKDLTLVRKS